MKVKLNLNNRFNPVFVWVVDSIMSTTSTLLAILLLHMVMDLSIDSTLLFNALAISLVTSVIVTHIFHTYEGIIRHTSAKEMIRVMYSMLAKAIIIAAVANLTLEYTGRFVYSIIIFDFVLSTTMLMGFRVVVSSAYYHFISMTDPTAQRSLIFNTSNASAGLANYLLESQTQYLLKGFVVTSPKEKSRKLLGLRIYPLRNEQDYEKVFRMHNINTVLFAKMKDLRSQTELVDYCLKNHITLQLTSFTSVDNNTEKILLNNVEIEDLLGREEINIDMNEIGDMMSGKTVLVTGAAGSIGSELCRQLICLNLKRLIIVDFSETALYQIDRELKNMKRSVPFIAILGDVRNKARIESIMDKYRPDIVFHAAAYKHVPMMEKYPCEGVRTNVGGTSIVADLAVKYNVGKFILISTDKAVRPSNVMGATKRLAEMYVQSMANDIKAKNSECRTSFITTRFGNVLGSNGSVIPLFREQIKKGGPVTVTHPEVVRYFMTIPEACRLVLEASCIGTGNDIFIFDMGNPVRISDLASRMIELSGLKPGIDIEIKYIGLRPGEKLYEEVLYSKEDTMPTSNAKIFHAKRVSQDHEKITADIEELLSAAAANDTMETVRLLKRSVPEFKSQNSEFEELDK